MRRQTHKANALKKIFQRNEHDLIRAAKLQSSYDEIYDDIDAREHFAQGVSDAYSLYAIHHLQQNFRDTFIHLMKHKELAEQLAQFNILVSAPTDESSMSDALATKIETVSNYVPFGSSVVSPLTTAIRQSGDKLGEKNKTHREEEKKSATASVNGSGNPPYEVVLRLVSSALAESCESMLLLIDKPEADMKPVMDYLVNDRMKHALQKKIWTLNTVDHEKKSPNAVTNLARNIFFSVHILEKSGGMRFGMKSIMGARYAGPTVAMCGYKIKLEKYLRRQFIAFENDLYIPLKKKEASEKTVDKNAVLSSMGAELAILLLAEGGRVVNTQEEKAALDSALSQTKRGSVVITKDEIKFWLANQEKFITKTSGKKFSTLSLTERLDLVENKITDIQTKMHHRQSQSIQKTAHEMLLKRKNKILDGVFSLEALSEKLEAMLTGLKMRDEEVNVNNTFSPTEKMDFTLFLRLPARMMLSNAAQFFDYYKRTDITDEFQAAVARHNLSMIRQALLFKMLDKLPACFDVEKSADDKIIWQPKHYEKMTRLDELNAFKKALVLLHISIADKKAWIEQAVLELQERINQSLVDAENRLTQGRAAALDIQSRNDNDASKKIHDFNQQVTLYHGFLVNLQRDLRAITLNDFMLDDNLVELKHIRSQVGSVESCLSSSLLNENFVSAKTPTAAIYPVVRHVAPATPAAEPVAKPGFFQRIWNRVKEIFGFTKQYVKDHPVRAGAIGTAVLLSGGVVGAATCITTTAVLFKMGVAAKTVCATKTLVESGIAGAAMAEATLIKSTAPNASKEQSKDTAPSVTPRPM